MNNLTKLNICTTYPLDISLLTKLVQLKNINLGRNRKQVGRGPHIKYQEFIFTIWQLKSLVNIQILAINRNDISDISVLQYMPHLVQLVANDNNISNIDSLASLFCLVELQIQENIIVDVSPLANLPLVHLDISENKIQSFQSIKSNKNFNSFFISDQSQPTTAQILFSSKQKNIFEHTKRLKNMNRFELKKCKNKINKSVQRAKTGHELFLTKAVQLFQHLQTEEYQ
ncbi:leucine-rich_repeat domain-containing protein [Hexamita inflata]|uniref:Leucine-rich_repeat domain-containing protein n=1 Tax=Hexamita inflata TaxID=28002 RepID=A0ABP1GL05_9EUKA